MSACQVGGKLEVRNEVFKSVNKKSVDIGTDQATTPDHGWVRRTGFGFRTAVVAIWVGTKKTWQQRPARLEKGVWERERKPLSRCRCFQMGAREDTSARQKRKKLGRGAGPSMDDGVVPTIKGKTNGMRR